MTDAQAAVLAAAIAAGISIVSLVATLLAGWRTDTKAAYRRTFESFLSSLSDSVHSTIATAIIIGKTKSPKARENWRNKAKGPKDCLKDLARKVKYPLWGLSDHLQTLSRLPDWADHLAAAKAPSAEFDELAREYGAGVDDVIKDAFLRGRPPRKKQLRRLDQCRERIQDSFRKTSPPKNLEIFAYDEL